MTITTPDAQLVAGHLAGDPAALAGIYDKYADSLHDTAAAMLGQREDAADVLQDVFLIAASKLGQLRDPDRLKPWMFAILRNEVYRRTKQRKRTVATDFSNDDLAAASGFDMADERGLDAASDAVERDELAVLLRGAARGLDERDQLVLELSVRQGLDGQDLADALGVSANQSYTLVHRMRERVEKSLGAFCVAKAGRKDCDELDAILGAWDGEFTVLIRKRVARHIERCETCADSRRKVAPLALFAGAPAFAAPAALRDRILGAVHAQSVAAGSGGASTPYAFSAEGGFPRVVAAGRRLAAWVAPTAAASILLVAAGAGFWFIGLDTEPGTFQSAVVTTTAGPATTAVPPTTAPATTAIATTAPARSTTAVPATTAPPTTAPPTTAPPTLPPTTPAPTTVPPRVTSPPTNTPPPVPGRLAGSGTSVMLGNDASRTFTLSNAGGQPVQWTVSSAAPFTMSPIAGTLAPDSSTPITIGLDRSNLAEGSDPSVTVTFTGANGQSLPLAISATVNRPPVISNVNGPDVICVTYLLGGVTQSFWQADISASIVDESSATGTFVISGPGGRTGSATAPAGTGWSASADNLPNGDQIPQSPSGTWNWTITATDQRGNSSSTSGSVPVTCS